MDLLYYHTLQPLTEALQPFAAILFVCSFFLHWVIASWLGVMQQGKPFAWIKNALFAIVCYLVFFVPLRNPAAYIGFPDKDAPRTTIALFLLERLATGVDAMAKGILAWDVTIQALESQEPQSVDVPGYGAVQLHGEPNDADIMLSFLILRAQFLASYIELLWDQTQVPEADNESGVWGTWDILRSLAQGGDMRDYLVQKVMALVYALGSAILWLVTVVLLALISGLVLLLAGAARYAAVFIMALFLFFLPIGYLIRGRRVLLTGVNLIAVYLFLKIAVVIVVWLAFFLVEAVFLQGARVVGAEGANSVMIEMADRFEPGFLYTDAGKEMLFSLERQARVSQAQTTLTFNTIAMLTILLAMVYLVFKLPSLVAAMLGLNSLSEDLFSTLTYFFLATVGFTKLKGGGNQPSPNQISQGAGPNPGPSSPGPSKPGGRHG